MGILGIKAHFGIPDVCSEALQGCAAPHRLGLGRVKLSVLCVLCSSLSSCGCREQFPGGFGLLVYMKHWEEILISTTPPKETWVQMHFLCMILKLLSPHLCCRMRVDVLCCGD